MLLALLGAFLSTAEARAEGELVAPPPGARPSLRVQRVDVPPRIDGRLIEEVWKNAPSFTGLRQTEPNEGAPMTERTVLKFLYDQDFLYVGVRAYDDPEKITANTMLRDEPTRSDDSVNLNFDTFLDERHGYTFGIGPVGAKVDALLEAGQWVPEWDGVWYLETSIDTEGWVAEVAIPFKTLGFKPGSTRWGFQAMRIIKRKGETGFLVNATRNRSPFDLSDLAILEGLEGIDKGVGVDVKPSFSVRHLRERDEERRNYSGDPSLDMFYRISPSLTGVLTTNTDFAESDVDLRQVNLTRFALFFPEQRDFFLQDARIFSFADRDQGNGIPFFSRRIGIGPDGDEVDIDAGVKVTGRIGRFSLGALSVQTESHGDIERANLSVGRVRVNVLEESTVGLIATHGSPWSKNDNSLAGVDFNFRTSKFRGDRSLEASVWAQRTWSEGSRGRDVAWGGRLAYPNDRVRFSFEAQELRENFNPALGFVNRVGIRQYDGSFRYRLRPDGGVHTLDTLIEGQLVTDVDDHLESSRLAFTPVELANVIGDRLALRYVAREERLLEPFEISEGIVLPADRYQFSWGEVTVAASRSRMISGELTFGWGAFFSGRRFETRLVVFVFSSKHFNLTFESEQNDVRLDEGSFTARLARLRVDLQFDPRLSWSTIAQYDNITDSVGLNTRLRWIVDPGNEIFFVLNHGFDVDRSRLRSSVSKITAKVAWTLRF